jgi:predicted nucleic acid-binding protein
VRSILIDAASLIALFDRSDKYHLKAVIFMKDFRGKLWTNWPVVTEVSHMLNFSTTAQQNFLIWIQRGGLQLVELNSSDISWLIELTAKSTEVPMDLADATLILSSEKTGFKEIASIDTDFYIYRDVRNQYLSNVFM